MNTPSSKTHRARQYAGPAPPTANGPLAANSPTRADRVRITQKPGSVTRELAEMVKPGGTALDFCAGSGSTGVAALLQGRDFIGVEATAHCVDIAE